MLILHSLSISVYIGDDAEEISKISEMVFCRDEYICNSLCATRKYDFDTLC